MTTDHDREIRELRAQLDAMAESMVALGTANARLEARVDQLQNQARHDPGTTRRHEDGPGDRRAFLRGGALTAGALAAGAASSIVGASPAAAADNDELFLGVLNQAASPTRLLVDNGVGDLLPMGLAVSDAPIDPQHHYNAAAVGYAIGDSLGAGVMGFSSAEEGSGIVGLATSGLGVDGQGRGSSTGVQGSSESGLGVRALTNSATSPALDATSFHDEGLGIQSYGRRATMRLLPTSQYPLEDGVTHQAGELVAFEPGIGNFGTSLYFCVEGGTPGLWRRLASKDGTGSLVVLPSPQRAYDSRPGNPPEIEPKTKLTGDNSPRIIETSYESAQALLVNLTVVNTSAAGFVALHKAGTTWPGNSSINWTAANTVIANSTTVALDDQGRLAVTCAAGASTDIIIDIVGYYF